MAYVITQPCIGSKDSSCVDVCPVDCIHPTPDEPGYAEAEQLYIDPDVCIGCNACAQACPVSACLPDDEIPDKWLPFVEANAAFFTADAGGSRT